MDIGEIILTVLPAVLTFIVGYVMKSPIYQKGKRLLSALGKALEDDKITAAELQDIIDSFNPPTES